MPSLNEKFSRALDRAKAGREFKDKAELEEFLNQFIGKNIDELVESQELGPEDQALELVDQAGEAHSQAEALDLLRRAVEVDPKYCEARVQLAQWKSRSDGELIRRLDEAIADEADRVGEAYFKKQKGAFWGFHETRPYMRACFGRATILLAMGRLEEAQKALRTLILLNKQDNQGVRMALGPLCLRRGDLKAYRALRNKFKKTMDLELAWSDVLEALLQGNAEKAAALRAEARAENGYLEAYLIGHRKLPKHLPASYTWESPKQAICAAVHLIPAWAAHPEALAWLKRTR